MSNTISTCERMYIYLSIVCRPHHGTCKSVFTANPFPPGSWPSPKLWQAVSSLGASVQPPRSRKRQLCYFTLRVLYAQALLQGKLIGLFSGSRTSQGPMNETIGDTTTLRA